MKGLTVIVSLFISVKFIWPSLCGSTRSNRSTHHKDTAVEY